MNKHKRGCLFSWVNILAALTAGLAVYLLYGTDTYIAGMIQDILGMRIEQAYRQIPASCPMRFLRCYGCDMLWAYALVHTLWLFLGQQKKDLIRFCLGSCLFGIVLECLQGAGVLAGTFDIWDMVLEGTAAALAGLVIFCVERGRTYERENSYEKEIDESISSFHGTGRIFPDGRGKRIR